MTFARHNTQIIPQKLREIIQRGFIFQHNSVARGMDDFEKCGKSVFMLQYQLCFNRKEASSSL